VIRTSGQFARGTVAVVCAGLLLTGCASEPRETAGARAGHTVLKQVVGTQPSIKVVSSGELDGGDGWRFDPGPVVPGTEVISADAAEATVADQVYGHKIYRDATAVAALAYVTNETSRAYKPIAAHTLAWVVQITGVPIYPSGPKARKKPPAPAELSAVQWVVDAMKGECIEGRTFGAPAWVRRGYGALSVDVPTGWKVITTAVPPNCGSPPDAAVSERTTSTVTYSACPTISDDSPEVSAVVIECLIGKADRLYSGSPVIRVVGGQVLRGSATTVYLQQSHGEAVVYLSNNFGATELGRRILASVAPSGGTCSPPATPTPITVN
jgi:hypothetical protein